MVTDSLVREMRRCRSVGTAALRDVWPTSDQNLLSRLQQPRLVRLKSSHLLQDPLLLVLAHEPGVRSSAVSRTLGISKKLSDNPLRSVDATVTEAEL